MQLIIITMDSKFLGYIQPWHYMWVLFAYFGTIITFYIVFAILIIEADPGKKKLLEVLNLMMSYSFNVWSGIMK